MMDWQRTGLFIGMGVIVVLLLIEWSEFQERQQPVVATNTATSTSMNNNNIPQPENTNTIPVANAPTDSGIPTITPTQTAPVINNQQGSQQISIKTDTLDVIIDTFGGDIVKTALPQYPIEIDKPNDPLVLLNQNQSTIYVARSGLIGANGTDVANKPRPLFSVAKTDYELLDGEDSLQVDLTLTQNNVDIIKRFTFTRGENLIKVEYIIDNQSDGVWSGNFYGQIRRDDHEPVQTGPSFGASSFLGVATSTRESNYEKFDFDDITTTKEKFDNTGGWMAMVQHYFVSAWIPKQDDLNNFEIYKLANTNEYIFGFFGPAVVVPPGQQGVLGADFYSGPKDLHRMQEIATHLELTIDYGFLFFISKPLFYFLHWIHSFVGNWGIAIILMTVSVKAAFFHLSAAGYRSMAKMRKFAPKMAELKERYGDNRQKMSEETMKLYKKEKVNPLGGCLPMLVQMPVFLAFYWVLMESVELRHAPLFLWINDLSVKDPFFILPLIYGATFWFQQKLNPTPPDPTQAKIMQMMPFVFTVMFLFFPAGLVLYWVVNGGLSMAQQYVITKQIDRADTKS
ncbi:membrane protein insertase YidC [Aurantivibrio infirmus]